ncbi:MAG TPA: branched-chain amino acid ABC transporter permease [Dehalococcoidia bacterium]|nr:branched-chain amino acid ABC transporter permease [Dehalococcoidia bacterium]
MNILSFYVSRSYQFLRGEILVIPSRTIALLLCLFLLFFPLISANDFILRVLILASIYAIFAASWDLLSGYTGQINFGHALFFGVAAYTAGLLNYNLDLAPWATIPIGALAAVVAGLVIGIPCLRLRGTYLAFATLAFPLILLGVVSAISSITGGERGFSGVDPLAGSRVASYYIVFPSMMVLGFIMWKIADSNTGLIFHAIREDEVTARASGINTTRYKLLAFCLSGLFAGIAGGMYVHFMKVAGPSTLELLLSFQVIIWAVFGGIATIYGPIAGVFILYPLREFLLSRYLHVPGELTMLIFACIVLIVLLFMPQGLITWLRDKTEKICPRCKLQNVATRSKCRVCTADLD